MDVCSVFTARNISKLSMIYIFKNLRMTYIMYRSCSNSLWPCILVGHAVHILYVFSKSKLL